MLVDKYCRLRTDMEDMICAHMENVKTWAIIKDHYESKKECPPTVCFEQIVSSLYETQESLLSALVRAKNWMDNDFDKKMTEHDMELYDSTMEAINQAINKATQ